MPEDVMDFLVLDKGNSENGQTELSKEERLLLEDYYRVTWSILAPMILVIILSMLLAFNLLQFHCVQNSSGFRRPVSNR